MPLAPIRFGARSIAAAACTKRLSGGSAHGAPFASATAAHHAVPQSLVDPTPSYTPPPLVSGEDEDAAKMGESPPRGGQIVRRRPTRVHREPLLSPSFTDAAAAATDATAAAANVTATAVAATAATTTAAATAFAGTKQYRSEGKPSRLLVHDRLRGGAQALARYPGARQPR